MKKLISLILTAVISLSVLCSCATSPLGEDLASSVKADEDTTYVYNKNETSAPTSYTSFQSAAISFSTKILSSMLEEDDNAVYSPAALYYQLSLLQNAMSGATQNSLKKLTGENAPVDDINDGSGYFFSRLETLSNFNKNRYIDINGDIIFNDDVSVSQNFLLKNADFYKEGIFRLSFADNFFTDKVSSYFKTKTNNKTRFKLSPDKSCGITMFNSAYMSDSWLDGYSQEKTSSGKFNGVKGAQNAEFLNSVEYYLENKDCEGFVKDFKYTPAKFVALLPKSGDVKKLASKLNSSAFLNVMDSMSVFKTCDTYIPKFSKKDTVNFADNKSLRFLKNEGNYSALSYGSKTKVSDIIQSFEINITNGGIGNGKITSSASTKKQPDKTVKLNRPFIFAVIDNESFIPVFMGAIQNV